MSKARVPADQGGYGPPLESEGERGARPQVPGESPATLKPTDPDPGRASECAGAAGVPLTLGADPELEAQVYADFLALWTSPRRRSALAEVCAANITALIAGIPEAADRLPEVLDGLRHLEGETLRRALASALLSLAGAADSVKEGKR